MKCGNLCYASNATAPKVCFMNWKFIIFCTVILLGFGGMFYLSKLQDEADKPLRHACLKATWPDPLSEWGTIPLTKEANDEWLSRATLCVVNAKTKEQAK